MHDGSVIRSGVPYPWNLAAPSWYALRSGVPNPWDLAAPSWYLLGMWSVVPNPWDTSLIRSIWCFERVRSWSPLLIHSRHVRSIVPNPWDPAAPTWCLVGMFDLMFLAREILQPRPVTSYACWNCCSFPVRSCIPTLIPRRHVRSDVPYLWDPAAPSLYPVGMFDLVFPTREILQPHPDTS